MTPSDGVRSSGPVMNEGSALARQTKSGWGVVVGKNRGKDAPWEHSLMVLR